MSAGAGAINVAAGSSSNPASIQAQFRTEWFQAFDRQEGITLCSQIVSEILQKSQDVIFQKHIDRQVLPYAIQFAKETMLRAIEWEFFKMDPGETDMSTWEPDPEPQPVRIDSWARGVLPIIEMPETNVAPAPALTTDSLTFMSKSKAELATKKANRSVNVLDKVQPSPLSSPRLSKSKLSFITPARDSPERIPSKTILVKKSPKPPTLAPVKPNKRIALQSTQRIRRPPEAA